MSPWNIKPILQQYNLNMFKINFIVPTLNAITFGNSKRWHQISYIFQKALLNSLKTPTPFICII